MMPWVPTTICVYALGIDLNLTLICLNAFSKHYLSGKINQEKREEESNSKRERERGREKERERGRDRDSFSSTIKPVYI